jgi:hypothetical protein
MSALHKPHCVRNFPVSYYRSEDVMRSRSVGGAVFAGAVDVPAPTARLVADWNREITSRLCLEAGDVEELSLARARARWPDYGRCVQAMADWTRTLGLQEVLASCDVALMACRGARYHHDGAQYGGMAFCNLFLSEDKGLDLHFPATGQRIPLSRGTVVLFDTCQPHAVIERHSEGFNPDNFSTAHDCNQVFLSWELPIEDALVGHVLGVAFDLDPSTALLLDDAQVWLNGTRANLCPDSGQWLHADPALSCPC